jgi:hypothetical protein
MNWPKCHESKCRQGERQGARQNSWNFLFSSLVFARFRGLEIFQMKTYRIGLALANQEIF